MPAEKIHKTKPIWRTAPMNKLSQILKKNSSWTVWKPQTNFKRTLWRHTAQLWRQELQKKTKPTCHHCKKRSHYLKNAVSWREKEGERERELTESTKIVLAILTVVKQPLTRTTTTRTTPITAKKNNKNNRNYRKPRTLYPPCETYGKGNHSTLKCYFGDNAANRPLWNKRPARRSQIINVNNRTHQTTQMRMSTLRSKYKQKTAHLHFATALDRPKTSKSTILLPFLEVVWQQHPETTVDHHKKDNFNKNFSTESTQDAHKLKHMQLLDATAQTWPPKGLQPQSCGTTTNSSEKLRLGTKLYRSSTAPKIVKPKSKKHISAKQLLQMEIKKFPAVTVATPQTEGRLMRDQQANELYLQLSSTLVLEQKNAVCVSGFR